MGRACVEAPRGTVRTPILMAQAAFAPGGLRSATCPTCPLHSARPAGQCWLRRVLGEELAAGGGEGQEEQDDLDHQADHA